MAKNQTLTPKDFQGGRLYTLWSEVEDLKSYAAARCPADDPLAQLLSAAVNAPDGKLPNIRKLISARNAFYALPASRQTEILNGWKPAPRPSLDVFSRRLL